MDYADEQVHPIKGLGGLSTEHATGAIVVGALLLLIMIRRGFRGINIAGIGVSVK